MRLGIISALHEEQQGLVDAMEGPYKLMHGMREYFVGRLWEIDAVCVLSRIGKVAAALTTATLVEKFGVTHILFTGVAGAGDASIRVGRGHGRVEAQGEGARDAVGFEAQGGQDQHVGCGHRVRECNGTKRFDATAGLL